VGLIKTLHDLYVSDDGHLQCLRDLRRGERSPVFLIKRARTSYYSWFVCLREPDRFEPQFASLARLEVDDAQGLSEAIRLADLTAAILPGYASTPERDDRAPQNLLPVGQLERELRHRLGDAEYVRRLVRRAFNEEEFAWTA
jgi:hypothetical protein